MLGFRKTCWTWFLGIACICVNTLIVSIANAQINPNTTFTDNSVAKFEILVVRIEDGATAGSQIPVNTEFLSTCAAGRAIAQSKFKIIGRNGLPTLPSEALTTDAVLVDLVTLKLENNQNPKPTVSIKPSKVKPKKIIEATGFSKNKKGEIFLVADASNGMNRSELNNNIGCGNVD